MRQSKLRLAKRKNSTNIQAKSVVRFNLIRRKNIISSWYLHEAGQQDFESKYTQRNTVHYPKRNVSIFIR